MIALLCLSVTTARKQVAKCIWEVIKRVGCQNKVRKLIGPIHRIK